MVVSGSELPEGYRLGDLLVNAGVVTSSDIVEALQVSKRLHTPLGRVLLASECLDEANLKAALEAQASVRHGASLDSATESLKLSVDKSIPYCEAAKEVDHRNGPVYWCQTVGVLLTDAKVVTAEQLARATTTSLEESVALPLVLVRENVLTTDFLQFVDKIYNELLELKVSRYEFVSRIQEAHRLWTKAGIST
jgi:hypothetical protein